jgi:hypothetical protein
MCYNYCDPDPDRDRVIMLMLRLILNWIQIISKFILPKKKIIRKLYEP